MEGAQESIGYGPRGPPARPNGDPSLVAGTTPSLGYTNVPGTSSEISTDSVTGPSGARLNSVPGIFEIPMSAT